jgi:hypothetical protein
MANTVLSFSIAARHVKGLLRGKSIQEKYQALASVLHFIGVAYPGLFVPAIRNSGSVGRTSLFLSDSITG